MKTSLLVVLMLMMALTAPAQQAEPAEVPGGGQAQAPPTLLGQRPPRELLSGPTTPNYLSGGIAISQLFTDNALLTTSNQISDLSYTFQPHLTFAHSSARLSCSLGVLAGFIVNRTLDEQNQATQNFNLDLSYGLTRHTTFRVSESFTNSTGLWSGASTSTSTDSGGGIGAIQAPTSALYTFARFQSNAVLLELSRQFTLRDLGGVRGGISSIWYPDTATSPGVGTLYGGQTYSAEAFYNHQFTLRQWAGVTLRAERFDVNQLTGRTDTVSALFLYGINLRPTISLSLFGGPALSIT